MQGPRSHQCLRQNLQCLLHWGSNLQSLRQNQNQPYLQSNRRRLREGSRRQMQGHLLLRRRPKAASPKPCIRYCSNKHTQASTCPQAPSTCSKAPSVGSKAPSAEAKVDVERVCVYYCSTYYKVVHVGGGG
jgi:hypothetical protein